MSDQKPSQSTDQSADSDCRVTRTYGRTYEDEMVTLRATGCEPNAREPQTEADPTRVGSTITPIELGRSLRFAESNGAKVITAVDLPEPVLEALAGLVDAIQREFGDETARRLAAEDDQPRPMCRWHPGQYAEHCGPCRSERIAAR